MTEQEAWNHLAAEWESPILTKTGWASASADYGLCGGIDTLAHEGKITGTVRRRMLSRFDNLPRDDEDYCWPSTREGAVARARFCREQGMYT